MDEFKRLYGALMSNSSAVREYTAVIKQEIESRNRVDISLAEYEAMVEKIDELYERCQKAERELENIKEFLKETHLPAEVIAEGVYMDMDWEIEKNPLSLTTTYMVKVTVDDHML